MVPGRHGVVQVAGNCEGATGEHKSRDNPTYGWMQGLEKLLVIKRSGRHRGGMGETWCELAHACVVREAHHGDPRMQTEEALHLSHTFLESEGTVTMGDFSPVS